MNGNAFLALQPSAEAVSDYERWCECLPLRLTRPSGWHVTLAFLGQLSDVELETVRAAAADATRKCEPFSLRLSGSGTFGKQRRVLFAKVGGDVAALHDVARVLRSRLDERGIWYDERPFRPHLTVSAGRVSATEALAGHEKLDAYRGPQWCVEEIEMYRSVAGEAGERPHYDRLWTVALGAGNPSR